MTQGSISVVCGVHSPIHSLCVLWAWRVLYRSWPKGWEIVCIFLHDVGHWGLQYLDSVEEKRKHWRRGAEIARRLFGQKGFDLCAGHVHDSGYPISRLYKADKYAWHITPWVVLVFNTFPEPKIAMGYSRLEAVRRFRAQVKQSIESGEFRPTHQMYLERCRSSQ